MNEDKESTERMPETLEVGPEALRGLAHPLRARLLDELQVHGSATATILGARLGESSGSTSYHLRQLARFGFVEADPGRSGRRERWWRIRPGGWHMRGYEFLRSPATREAAAIVLDRYYSGRRERAERWRELVQEAPEDPRVRRWRTAMQDSVFHMRMTPEETEEFAGALNTFVREWAQRFQDRTAEAWPETESVEFQTDLFPNLTEPGEQASEQAQWPGRERAASDEGGTHTDR